MQGKYVIAYDLGTGGLKASLHDASGTTLAFLVCEYPTLYYKEVFHEQRPEDWRDAVVSGIPKLLQGFDAEQVAVRAEYLQRADLRACHLRAQSCRNSHGPGRASACRASADLV